MRGRPDSVTQVSASSPRFSLPNVRCSSFPTLCGQLFHVSIVSSCDFIVLWHLNYQRLLRHVFGLSQHFRSVSLRQHGKNDAGARHCPIWWVMRRKLWRSKLAVCACGGTISEPIVPTRCHSITSSTRRLEYMLMCWNCCMNWRTQSGKVDFPGSSLGYLCELEELIHF